MGEFSMLAPEKQRHCDALASSAGQGERAQDLDCISQDAVCPMSHGGFSYS
jgi:hypothetical protein